MLLPQKAIYWPRKSALLLADLHLGKARHFRKEGIGVPEAIGENDYLALSKLINDCPVDHVYFLGDLFHSVFNKEWRLVGQTVSTFSDTAFHLVLGNHDILKRDKYESAGLKVYDQTASIGPFLLTHEPPEPSQESDKFIFCGHLHPGISIRGKGRQYVRLPCFYKCDNHMILPAFGTFTGIKTITLTGDGIAYAILGEKVVAIEENHLSRKKARG